MRRWASTLCSDGTDGDVQQTSALKKTRKEGKSKKIEEKKKINLTGCQGKGQACSHQPGEKKRERWRKKRR